MANEKKPWDPAAPKGGWDKKPPERIVELPWWDPSLSSQDAAAKARSTFRALDAKHAEVREFCARALSAYLNREVGDVEDPAWTLQRKNSTRRENLIRACTDAATAKMSTARPRPVVMTTDADWGMMQASRQMQLFLEAVMTEQSVGPKGRAVFKDGCLATLAAVKGVADFDAQKVVLERVLRHELVWDPEDARYGYPRTLYQHKHLPRSRLRALLAAGSLAKDAALAVDQAGLMRGQTTGSAQGLEDHVSVVEAWHLPSGPEAGDGVRVWFASDGPLLLKAPWTRATHPFAFWRWATLPMGLDGEPMFVSLEPFQEDYDLISARIRNMLATTHKQLWVELRSKAALQDNSSDGEDAGSDPDSAVGTYTGEPPVYIPDPGPPEVLLLERQRIKAAAFEEIGLNQLLSMSQVPRGLQSRPAMAEYKDTESQRFADKGQDWDEFHCGPGGLAELIMDTADDLAVGKVDVELWGPRGRNIKRVKWSEVSKYRRSLQVSIWPAAMLPRDPAGRIDRVQTFLEMFPQSSSQIIRYLDHPDVESLVSYMTAETDVILRDIEMLEEGELALPDGFTHLAEAKRLVMQAYHRAKAAGAPESVLKVFRAYLDRVKDLLEKEAQAKAKAAGLVPPGALPGMPAGAPMGPGGAPPPVPAGMPMPPTIPGVPTGPQ